MPNYLIKVIFKLVVLNTLFFASMSAQAYYSNDPQGDIFIKRPFGDT